MPWRSHGNYVDKAKKRLKTTPFLRLFAVLLFEIRAYRLQKCFGVRDKLLGVCHGTDIEILIVAAVANDERHGDRFAEFRGQNLCLMYQALYRTPSRFTFL